MKITRMRVCFFTENHYKGGLDTFLINLFNAWPVKDDDLILMCNDTHPGLETIEAKTQRPLQVIRYRRFFTGKLASGHQNMSPAMAGVTGFVFRILYRILEYPVLVPWYSITLARFFKKNSFQRLMVVNGG
ncbi:MAG: hypothetical protein ABI581_16340, partial [Sediminibacterium sp.]